MIKKGKEMSKLIKKYDTSNDRYYLGKIVPAELSDKLIRQHKVVAADITLNSSDIVEVPLFFNGMEATKYYVKYIMSVANTGLPQRIKFQFLYGTPHSNNYSKVVITKSADVASDADRIIVEHDGTGVVFLNLNNLYTCRTLSSANIYNYFKIEGIIYNELPCIIHLGIAKETPSSAALILKENSFLITEVLY